MEFVKRHDTTDTVDFCPRKLVTDLLQTYYEETGLRELARTNIYDVSYQAAFIGSKQSRHAASHSTGFIHHECDIIAVSTGRTT